MLFIGALSFAACSSDDDEDDSPVSITGIPDDSQAGEAPVVTTNTVAIPNISAPYIEQGTNGAVGNINFTGIKGLDGDFLNLAGTGAEGQNIWMTIDGKPKSITIVNGADVTRAAAKGLADIVFLIDDSGSMDQEADSVAKQIVNWSKVLAKTVDCRFGCIGYGATSDAIDGAMDLNIIDSLDYFLNERSNNWYGKVTGTYRTVGFWGPNADRLQDSVANYDHYGYSECGGVALHFADEQFSFRDGANRIYLNFTDEPNQPDGKTEWSVESVNPQNMQDYNWNPSKGTIHNIISEDTTYFFAWDSERLYYSEKPWLMSEYTGGITLFTNESFNEFKLDDIEVTAAIVSSYILRFNITDDLKTGNHDIIITVKDNKGNQATKEFKNVTFNL